jgi:hypothetical protein
MCQGRTMKQNFYSKQKMLDLCCGLKGASREFKKAGWDVLTVDIDPKFNPDIVADVNDLHLEGRFDLIWASPRCDEFTKYYLPESWVCNGGTHKLPDMRLFLNCYRIIRYLNPRWWIIENVIGAKGFFSLVIGDPVKYGSRYLWGEFPLMDPDRKKCYGKWKLSPTKDRPAIRSEIPAELSKALCQACGAMA